MLGKGCFGLSLTCIMIYKPEPPNFTVVGWVAAVEKAHSSRGPVGRAWEAWRPGHTVRREDQALDMEPSRHPGVLPQRPQLSQGLYTAPSPESRLRGSPTEPREASGLGTTEPQSPLLR